MNLRYKILALLILFLFNLIFSTNTYAQSNESKSASLNVSAIIGIPAGKLYGYTSPNAEVELTGSPDISQKQNADSEGYFEFSNFFIGSQTSEVCLTARDLENRITSPVCIPTPLSGDFDSVIGPVILSPSISVAKGSFFTSETIEASGQSLPNSEVNISFFSGRPSLLSKLTTIVPSAYATALPSYKVKTDSFGNYSFNLPSSSANTFRVFSQALFEGNNSPKSNTLTFKVISLFQILIFIIILLLFILFLILYLKRHKKKYLMIVNNKPAVITSLPEVIDYQLDDLPKHIYSKLVKGNRN